jgi:hypothetical protein
MSSHQVPTLGDAVRVRNSSWLVTHVHPPAQANGSSHHVVTLRSIGEDDRGRSEKVVWEVEPGRGVINAFDVPEPTAGQWDAPDRMDAFLRAVQWGSVTNADTNVLEAPFRSGIDLKTYQLEPLVRALDMSRAMLLIADDVGLGKTIEAGLVLQEFYLRHRVGNCLIVCPASLVEKWQNEMRERFGLDFRVLDTAFEREVARTRGRHVNPFGAHPWLVTSIDWLKRPEREQLLAAAVGGREPDEYPRPFDMLILDEAHIAAPAGKNYPVDSARTELIDHFGAFFEHRLFLTATPHNGHKESFWALLHLLDRVRFHRELEPTDRDVDRVMVRRLKRHVKEVDPTAPFPDRVIHTVEAEPLLHEDGGYDLLDEYLTRLKDLNNSGLPASAVRFMGQTLRKRFTSSPAAFARTIGKHADTIESRGRHVSLPSGAELTEAIERAGDAYDDDDAADAATDIAVETTTAAVRVDDTVLDLLGQLRDWAARNSTTHSGRLTALRTLIDQVCTVGGDWDAGGRLIVFTEYRDTHRWLVESLVGVGVPAERIAQMYGGMPADRRAAVAELFNRKPGNAATSDGQADLERKAGSDRRVRVLIATDTASEGIDLQRFCHHLLHFDLPYNPSRMEQRNGRIDRHGQPADTADVHVFTANGTSAFASDTSQEARLAEKLAAITEDVGTSNALFAVDLMEAHISAVVDRDPALLDAYYEQAQQRRADTMIEEGTRKLRELVDKASVRIEASRRRLDATPGTVADMVAQALAMADQQPLIHTVTEGVFALPGGDGRVGLAPEWTDTIPELVDRMSGRRRHVTFTPELADVAPAPIHLHLNHPFVAHAAALLRAQVWSTGGYAQLRRVTARTYDPSVVDDPNVEPDDVVVVAHARVLVMGGTTADADAEVLHEDVVARCARLRNGNWAQIRTDAAADRVWAARSDTVPADPDRVLERWHGVAEPLSNNLTDRANTVADQLAENLRGARDREIKALREEGDRIARDLRHRVTELTDELDRDAGRLFSEWSPEELAAKRRNRDRLEQRLGTVSFDFERAVAAISDRYDDVTTFVMPIALTFLHPEEPSRG